MPEMSAREATQFDRFSVQNAATAEDRACDCRAYVDIFTLRRWNAQGFRVRGGEHGVKVPTLRRVTKKRKLADGTEERVSVRLRRASTLFCRCQVERG